MVYIRDMYLLILFKLFIPVAIRTVRHEAKFYTNAIENDTYVPSPSYPLLRF